MRGGKLFGDQAGSIQRPASVSGDIRDTDPHDSGWVKTAEYDGGVLIAVKNNLNKTVNLTFQGTFEPEADTPITFDLDTAAPASGGEEVRSLTDPWPAIRVVARASITPTSGSLDVWFIGRRQDN